MREKASTQEYERKCRKLAEVKTEHDILKKRLGYFAADLRSVGLLCTIAIRRF